MTVIGLVQKAETPASRDKYTASIRTFPIAENDK